MKIIYVIIITFLYQFSLAQYGQELNMSDAFQSAIDIQTSGVKIVRDYVFRGLKSGFVSKEIDNNLSKGEKSLIILDIYSEKFPYLKTDIKQIKNKWKKLRNLSIQKPERSKMDFLLSKLESFLKSTKSLISKIKETKKLKIINYQEYSNQMELLSQQITLLYALQVAKIKDPMIEKEMKNCTNKFNKNLKETFHSGENTIEISNVLKKIQADWELSKRTLNNNQEQLLNTLYIMMNKISNQARKAAILYQKMANDELKK